MSLQIESPHASQPGFGRVIKARQPMTVAAIFGTRPEAIKLAPVIDALNRARRFRVVTVFTGQHPDLARPAQELFGIRHDYDLAVMVPDQPLSTMCGRLLSNLDPLLLHERPDLVLVQGDTTSAMAGALSAFHRHIAVGHVEAGLRTNDAASPFPEEINRQMITRLATYHFAATNQNVKNLLREGVPARRIALTGNPVVDALHRTLKLTQLANDVGALVPDHHRLIVLTSHRRESFGPRMRENLRVIRAHLDRVDDLVIVFPVHPNPSVTAAANEILGGHPRIRLVAPLPYASFVHLLARAWLIISDSGGVQEEAPTLRRPLIVLRETTERPEAVECGVARLTGGHPERLAALLALSETDTKWFRRAASCPNPFGNGNSGEKIAQAIWRLHSPHTVDASIGAP